MDWICGIERNQGQLPSLKMGRWEDNCPITEMGVRAHELVWGVGDQQGRRKGKGLRKNSLGQAEQHVQRPQGEGATVAVAEGSW